MILVTGAAGFIGYHLSSKLCTSGQTVIGIDNLNDYYEVSLKEARLANLKILDNFIFEKIDLEDSRSLDRIFKENKIEYVINLAAQAGVRYSLTNPHAYLRSNIDGFLNILEACRHNDIKHLLYASSSSVYGGNTQMPFSTQHNVDHPVSLYAATKKSNELMAHTYSHLYNIPSTGLRFFTVYGPYGRPDMALFIFTKAILDGKPIDVYNHGKMQRDFTYIDDIVDGIIKLVDLPPKPNQDWQKDPSKSFAPYKVYNIGNNAPVALLDFIKAIEKEVGKEAIKNFMPIQPGDVPATYADVNDLIKDTGFRPQTSIEYGVGKFVDWYKDYYKY